MFLKFSDEAQKLLLLSLKEKNKLNDSYIGSEHVFLAVLSMKRTNVNVVLNTFGITYDKFLSFFSIKEKEEKSNYLVFTPLLKGIFKSLGNNINKKNIEISVSDIIVEILSDPTSKVVYILRKMNIDMKKLLKSLNNNKKKKIVKKGILNDFGVNLNDKNSNDILIGRDDEINEIIEILCCKNKNNPILIGDAGVGKTAIVEELARRIERGDVPLQLRNKKIYSVSMSSLVAGTKYRGEFEEKINKLVTEVENDDDVILFIDEIHTLVGAGGADGAIDASNILKPSLARGIIKVIGATTKDEYNKYFLEDKALNRRFRIVLCEEPDVLKTKQILFGIKSIYENYHNVIIPDTILEQIVYFSNTYIKNKKFPDKAIDILDEVCVLSSFEKNKEYSSISGLDKKINSIIDSKNEALLMGNYKLAMDYSHEEKEIQVLISKKQKTFYKNNQKIIVKEETLLKVMERKTNIPFYSFKFNYKNINKIIKDYKKKSIFNNDIVDNICDYTLNLYSSITNRGIGNSLWISSNNENLNNYFLNHYLDTFFKKNNIIQIDINNFRNIDDLLRYDDKNNLINKIRLYSFSILVVSNYDNCDYSIKDFLDKINKYGYYLDRNNEKIDFSNVFIIFSSLDKNSIGFKQNNKKNNYIYIENIDKNKLTKHIKQISIRNNIFLKDNEIKVIIDKVMFNCDNINNLEFLIRKIRNNSNKILDKKRTMQV